MRGKEHAGNWAVQQLYGNAAGGAGGNGDSGGAWGGGVSEEVSGVSGSASGYGGGVSGSVSGSVNGGVSGGVSGDVSGGVGVSGGDDSLLPPPPPSPPPPSLSSPGVKRKRIEIEEQGWAKKNHNMHIPRQTLRQLLLEPLLPECVLWNKQVILPLNINYPLSYLPVNARFISCYVHYVHSALSISPINPLINPSPIQSNNTV